MILQHRQKCFIKVDSDGQNRFASAARSADSFLFFRERLFQFLDPPFDLVYITLRNTASIC
ncbi:MAG: hypothetical protein D3906_07990 [Candidatus Electrothrix sp. AUS1_2]|nr:hypothetical protein [Candidatus Electrothrix sp. AUS1_2]